MFSSTSEVARLMGRRWKFWPNSFSSPLVSWWSSRRLIGRLLSNRLPILALWTLIVIFILYKSDLKDGNNNSKLQKIILNQQSDRIELGELKTETLELKNQLHDENDNIQDNDDKPTKYYNSVITNPPSINPHGSSAPLLTTKKSTIEGYSRQSKVFILIVQNDHHRRGQIFKKAPYFSPSVGESGRGNGQPSYASSDSHNSRSTKAFIPNHLRLLIEILNSHRIEYTIDTVHTGLPTSLLIDQDNPSEAKQYSVIVLDDFIKYTKLNRWVRDQLDRHCRSNQIGVVAYLTTIDDSLDQQSTSGYKTSSSQGIQAKTGGGTETTEESLANQFPLSFKPIEQHKSCSSISSYPNCLIDYQLNERSPILRMLKRRQNFIINGPVATNLNQSPWISMSSNHITYEPLTWAKYRGDKNRSHYNYETTKLNLKSAPSITPQTNHRRVVHSIRGRNAINVVPTGVPIEGSGAEADIQMPSSEHEQAIQQIHTTPDDSEQSITGFIPNDDIERQVLSIFDRGLYDGIKRVIFGGASRQWLDRILLLDAIEHLSSGRILRPLDRYIQIDIDDIFVGERGTRMNSSDVDALVEAQHDFAQRIDGGFKFNLGFSGKYYKHGFEHENLGDERLLSRAKEFTWFCHTWSHSKAHLFNDVQSIVMELRKNLEFARAHKIPLIGHNDAGHMLAENSSGNFRDPEMPPTYAVAPHHSGVYPIHEQLYDAWRQVLNVQVTSTEEYPHLRPASGRRAFVHKAIKVLPRQTCGLYTHTIYRDKYPGGFGKLEASIEGGELFETILHNPVNIYMSHMSNYANDRLALHTFGALIDFVQTNTNLQLKYVPSEEIGQQEQKLGPAELANHYFKLYPEEQQQPLWTNYCLDKRHLAIWAQSKHNYCPLAPKLLIVGPQKTGTTALYTFLKMNPLFRSSQMSATDFEEVQFFNDKHYPKGVDWYFSRFLPTDGDNNATSAHRGPRGSYHVYFDKSATYFDDPKAPKRASYLLPEARIVLLLVNPVDRAYSWYQHMRAHGDPAANSHSFEQIIMGSALEQQQPTRMMMTSSSNNNNSETSKATSTDKSGSQAAAAARLSLRNRCLHPGYYAQHLTKWLDYYPSRQVIIIDGQWFRYNPASVMNRLQLLLRVDRPLDYGRLLVYDQQKGFYCQRANHYSGAAAAADDHSESNGGKSADSSKGNFIKCLGESKGRKYGPMSSEARLYLNRHYWPHNRQLARILSNIGQPLPIWLDEAMTSVGHGLGNLAAMY